MKLKDSILRLLNIFLVNKEKIELFLIKFPRGSTSKNKLGLISSYLKLHYFLIIKPHGNTCEIIDLLNDLYGLGFLGSDRNESYISIRRDSQTLNKCASLNLYLQDYNKRWYLIRKNNITMDLINILK